MVPDGVERRLAAILSADAAGYSRLMAEDEAGTLRTLTSHRRTIASAVARHRGRIVDAPGDNVLAEFASVVEAVQSAVELQRSLAERNATLPATRRMAFRVGVHVGDVMAEGGRIYGDGVNVAARLEALAEPGGVCLSGEAYDQVRSKLPFRFEARGEESLKNIPRPVRVFAVRPEGEAVAAAGASEPPRRARIAAVVAGVALLGAVAWSWWALAPRARGPSLAAAPAEPIRSLAVLPLDNLSGDPEQEYFTDGMTEELISQLAKLGSLRVISRTSAMQFKGARRSVSEIAEALGVDAVVEGSVMRAGERVRISAQLIDARRDHHLWSESYERDLREVLVLQSEVARAVASEIRLAITPREEARLAAASPVKPAAYEAYLKGRHFIRKGTHESSRRAAEYFERAVREDPDWPLGWAGLAEVYS